MKKGLNGVITLILCLWILIPIPGLPVEGPSQSVEYTLNHQINIHLPRSMHVSEIHLDEQNQLLYSANLNDHEQDLNGYIQVWRLENIERFLAESKAMSPYDFYTYSMKPIRWNHFNGYLYEWGASFGDLTKISGQEYWLKDSERPKDLEVLRITFLTPQVTFTPEQLQVMQQILESISWKAKPIRTIESAVMP